MRYTNFDLTVGAFEKDFFISATLPGQGAVLGRFALPFRREEMVEWQHGLNETLAQEIGSALHDAVFQNDLRFALQDALRFAARNQDHLRLRLNLDAHANRLPWELLHQRATRQFLALDEHLSIVRQPTILEPLEPLLVNLPLRMLIVTAQARDAESLDIVAEKDILASAARDFPSGHCLVQWLEQPSLEQLRQTLQSNTYHILHFIGHGRFRADAEAGELQLVYPSGHGQWVTAAQLARIVRSERSLRVVFLNACDSGRSSSDNPFSGVAAELIRTGDVSAAIAMQFPITDRASLAFTRGFYQSLLQGKSLDAAVTQGRLAIDADVNHFEWATPALYLHAADGDLIARADVAQALHLEPIRSVAQLYGREADLERYRAALATRNFVIIEGMAGIGKTSIGAMLAQEQRRQGRHVYWITFDAVGKTGGEVFIWEIASLLRQHGSAQLWDFLQQEESSGRQPIARFNLLLSALQSGEYTLCFDDLHLVQDDTIIRQLFVQIQKLFRGQPERIPAKFIVMTRDVPEYMQYLERDGLNRLSFDAVREWLEQASIHLTPDELTRLDQKVEGNPQFLQLALQAGLAQAARVQNGADTFIRALEAQRNVREYLLEGMYAHLNDAEKRVLDVLCIFDGFVPLAAVQAAAVNENVQAVAYVVEELLHQNAVQEKRENGDIGLHALVRDWCYRNLDADTRQRLHHKAANYWRAQNEWVVAARHYTRAGNPELAAQCLTENVTALMRRGYADALLSELNYFTRAELNDPMWRSVLTARAQIFSHNGSEQQALDSFQTALALTADRFEQATLLERVGRSQNRLGKFADAAESFQHAAALGEELRAPAIQARACYGLANALIRQGQVRQGIESADRAIEIATQAGDHLLAAEAQLERGVGAIYGGETLDGIQDLQAALTRFTGFGREDLTANALLELGLAYHNLDELETAATYYHRALPLFERAGDLGNVSSVLNNLGDLEMGRGDFTAALEYLERAQHIALLRDDTYLQTLLYHTMAETRLAARDPNGAMTQLEQGLRLATEFEYHVLNVACRRTRAEIFALRRENELARAEFETVRALLENQNIQDMSEWLAFCAAYGRFLLSDNRERATACQYLTRALEYARALGARKQVEALHAQIAESCG